MKKILALALLVLTFVCQSVSAKETKSINLDKLISSSKLDKSATIAVSLRDAKTGEVEYQYNQEKLLHPASVLKLITIPVSLEILTPQYEYETEFTQDKNKNLFIKLSADPMLTSEQIRKAFGALPVKEVNNVYIDDKILDRFEWGIGWMWDDETNPRMAKISPYNLNQNILNVKITPTKMNAQPHITPLAKGTETVVNLLKTSDKDDIIVFRQNAISPNVVFLYGTVKNSQVIKIPVGNPERFFITNIRALLRERNVLNPNIAIGTRGQDDLPFYTITNEIKPIIPQILQESNNFYAETLFKTASARYSNEQGSFENEKKMFEAYYKHFGLDVNKIILADGSGVSRNNLFSADWISQAMFKIQRDVNFDYIKSNMAYPTNGTMKDRLVEYKDNFKAKTGTLANNSTIAGYLTDKKGKEHIITIFVANFNGDVKSAQELQDNLIKAVYNN